MLEPDLEVRAGDTEPIDYKIEIGSEEELSTADVVSMELYAWLDGSDTNHVDGGSVTVRGVSTEQNADGSWTNTFDVSFNPVGKAAGGGNAFDVGDDGTYLVYTKVSWTDQDDTSHPNDDERVWEILPSRE